MITDENGGQFDTSFFQRIVNTATSYFSTTENTSYGDYGRFLSSDTASQYDLTTDTYPLALYKPDETTCFAQIFSTVFLVIIPGAVLCITALYSYRCGAQSYKSVKADIVQGYEKVETENADKGHSYMLAKEDVVQDIRKVETCNADIRDFDGDLHVDSLASGGNHSLVRLVDGHIQPYCDRMVSVARALCPSNRDKSITDEHIYDVGESIRTGSMNLEVIDVVGQGGQATLYMVQHAQSVFAAKISLSSSTLRELRHEFDILSTISHPNIVAVYDEIPRGFLLECMAGDLLSAIERCGFISPDHWDIIGLGIAKAVSYLHAVGVSHLDIKPDNILITESSCPKLGDFGCALRFLNTDGSIRYLDEFRGSLDYAPPEMILLDSPFSMVKSDSWSLGATYFAMMSGHLPFVCNSQEQLLSNQLNGNYYMTSLMKVRIRNDPVYKGFMDMIQCLCDVQPETRWSVTQALMLYWNWQP